MTTVKLTKEQLRKDAETFTYPQMREKYKLSVAELKKAMNLAGITKPKVKTPKFEFVDDETTTESPVLDNLDTPEVYESQNTTSAPDFE